MIPLQEGHFRSRFPKIKRYHTHGRTEFLPPAKYSKVRVFSDHTSVRPSLVLLQLTPDIFRFHRFPNPFEKRKLRVVNFCFSKRLEEACFGFFIAFFVSKHNSPFYIFAVAH